MSASLLYKASVPSVKLIRLYCSMGSKSMLVRFLFCFFPTNAVLLILKLNEAAPEDFSSMNMCKSLPRYQNLFTVP